jgi:Fe-S oxidoreductase
LNLKSAKGVHYFRKITTAVAELTKRYRGSFSGEHGDGIVRGEFLPMLIGPKNYRLLEAIKTAFDPDNIFNPGKIVRPRKMDESLRYEVERTEPRIDTLMDFSASEGILKLAESCNGSGDCRKTEKAAGTMCPSYHATRDEKDSTRGRANVLREVLTHSTDLNKFNSEALKEVFDLCLSCKACASECPSNVDIATAKAEFQYQYNKVNGASRSTKLFAKSSHYNKAASRFPKFANFLFKNAFTSGILKKIGGIASERTIPKLSSISFSNSYKNIKYQIVSEYREVYLFVDEFSNYLEADIAKDAHELLKGLGYQVVIIDKLDSARALISKGFLEEAKKQVDQNVRELKHFITAKTPLLGIEPSAILGFRDEYPKLATDAEGAELLGKNCFLIEEFLAKEIQMGFITANSFTSEAKDLKIHVHCHQKALSNQKVTFDILNLPVNFKPVIIPSGCCGMAGSFGYEKEHYEVSMKIGELKLFPAIRKAGDGAIIVANGTSCRHQIMDGTGIKAQHPVSVLKDALLQSKTS